MVVSDEAMFVSFCPLDNTKGFIDVDVLLPPFDGLAGFPLRKVVVLLRGHGASVEVWLKR